MAWFRSIADVFPEEHVDNRDSNLNSPKKIIPSAETIHASSIEHEENDDDDATQRDAVDETVEGEEQTREQGPDEVAAALADFDEPEEEKETVVDSTVNVIVKSATKGATSSSASGTY